METAQHSFAREKRLIFMGGFGMKNFPPKPDPIDPRIINTLPHAAPQESGNAANTSHLNEYREKAVQDLQKRLDSINAEIRTLKDRGEYSTHSYRQLTKYGEALTERKSIEDRLASYLSPSTSPIKEDVQKQQEVVRIEQRIEQAAPTSEQQPTVEISKGSKTNYQLFKEERDQKEEELQKAEAKYHEADKKLDELKPSDFSTVEEYQIQHDILEQEKKDAKKVMSKISSTLLGISLRMFWFFITGKLFRRVNAETVKVNSSNSNNTSKEKTPGVEAPVESRNKKTLFA